MFFKKKPVTIEAVQWDGSIEAVKRIKALAYESGSEIVEDKDCLKIPTLEGLMTASMNDWVIKGVNGEVYPCKPDIFEKTYESKEIVNALIVTRSVYPSNFKSVRALDWNDIYEGAHKYHMKNCTGFKDGVTNYVDDGQVIQFVKKMDDGTMVPGLQSEQLVIMLIDRQKKLNNRFPSEFNEKAIAGLEMFLEACKERVDDRISRNVMGDLKK